MRQHDDTIDNEGHVLQNTYLPRDQFRPLPIHFSGSNSGQSGLEQPVVDSTHFTAPVDWKHVKQFAVLLWINRQIVLLCSLALARTCSYTLLDQLRFDWKYGLSKT